MKIIILIFLLNIFLSDENKNSKNFDLRNSNIKLEMNLEDLFQNLVYPSTILSDAQIEEIKNNAKNYKASPVTENDIVVFETNYGTIKFKLYPDKAPNHCKNFKKLCNSGFYDETLIFRVVRDFIIQGGDILTRDSEEENDGRGNPGWTIDAELNDLKHSRGVLSMSHGSDINSAGSQFFICVKDAFHLDGKYTAFGEIIENLDVIDRIASIESQSKQILSYAKQEIPKEEDQANWINYIFNEEELFFKIPPNKSKDIYREEISKKIKNIYSPCLPVRIQSIRVIDKNLLNNDTKSNHKKINNVKGNE